MMGGLARICKMYGGMVATDADGKTVKWVWDYANDVPVHEKDMPFGSERHKASEKAKWDAYIAAPAQKGGGDE